MARDGVVIRLNTTVRRARREGSVKILETVNNDVEGEIEADEILLSIGRVPNVQGLGLEAAGIEFESETGIRVDDFLRTTNSNVYAAGDVCMALKFTNAAQASARMAVRNALTRARGRQSTLSIPWCTYCDPEIAHIGLLVWEAREHAIPVRSFTIMMQDVDRAITDGEDMGFAKIHVEEGSDRYPGCDHRRLPGKRDDQRNLRDHERGHGHEGSRRGRAHISGAIRGDHACRAGLYAGSDG